MSSCTIVNEQDEIVGYKDRKLLTHSDIYRVAALWLTDSRTGNCLITQRKQTKLNSPGKWNTAVSGTVEENETYATNIEKETREEIGITNLNFIHGPKQYVDDGSHRFFCQWFYGRVDKDATLIVLQEEEVEAAKWVPVSELLADIRVYSEKYAPSALESLVILGVS